jgi:hypothetical protein
MRDSAADRFSAVMPIVWIVIARRFCTAPRLPRVAPTVWIAASTLVIAVVVAPPEPMSSAASDNVVLLITGRLTVSWSTPAVAPMPIGKFSSAIEPSNRRVPEKPVERPMRSTSARRSWNSWSRVSLSWLPTEPLLDWIASSRRRSRSEPTSFCAPSPAQARDAVGRAAGSLSRRVSRARAARGRVPQTPRGGASRLGEPPPRARQGRLRSADQLCSSCSADWGCELACDKTEMLACCRMLLRVSCAVS